MTNWEPALGADVYGNSTRFRVWAPEAKSIQVVIEPRERPAEEHTMTADGDGCHVVTLPGISEGDLYRYRIDGRGPFPDPASRFQPEGVHGPSEVVDWRHFPWNDRAWAGVALEDTVLYELHVGTFTPEGTFAAATERLPLLKDLGVTAVELMPVADFAGRWNWGYDGVAPFAPARCYGRPDDLRRLVDHAHALGLAVHLDVVYNHLGPDGAYQSAFSRFYYSQTHQSPWGAGINFDGPHSEPVRDYFIENALRWIQEYHFDGLRLDATHAVVDDSPRHILASISSAVHGLLRGSERTAHVIAEDVRNLAAMVKPESEGGWALDGVWSDDFHHQMRRALAGNSDGYFQDFDGLVESIATTARQGWFYTGQHAPYFGKVRGTDPSGVPKSKFVFFLQNHDQIGNRAFGERLDHQIDLAAWRAASVLLLTLPETPMLFMGQEWAASTPFLYFTDHHPELGSMVTEGRRREFAQFTAFADPSARENIPDPQSKETFRASRLIWEERSQEPHASTLRLYHRLLSLRREEPALRYSRDQTNEIWAAGEGGLIIHRTSVNGPSVLVLVGRTGWRAELDPAIAGANWQVILDTEDPVFAVEAQRPLIHQDPLSVEFLKAGAVVFRSTQ